MIAIVDTVTGQHETRPQTAEEAAMLAATQAEAAALDATYAEQNAAREQQQRDRQRAIDAFRAATTTQGKLAAVGDLLDVLA